MREPVIMPVDAFMVGLRGDLTLLGLTITGVEATWARYFLIAVRRVLHRSNLEKQLGRKVYASTEYHVIRTST